jgi:hypothetical protein
VTRVARKSTATAGQEFWCVRRAPAGADVLPDV